MIEMFVVIPEYLSKSVKEYIIYPILKTKT